MSHMSAWLVVCVTMERVLVLHFPTKTKKICRPWLARVVVLLLLIILAIFNFPVFGGLKQERTREPGDNLYLEYTICTGVSPIISEYVNGVYQILDSVLYSYAPTIILIILNILIINKFCRPANTISTVAQMPLSPTTPLPPLESNTTTNLPPLLEGVAPLSPMEPGDTSSTPPPTPTTPSISALVPSSARPFKVLSGPRFSVVLESVAFRTLKKNSRRMTKMAMAVSVAFLVATTPICIAYIFVDDDDDPGDPHGNAVLFLVGHIFGFLMVANHACNFIMYCMTSSIFRKQLKEMLKRCCRRPTVHHHGRR